MLGKGFFPSFFSASRRLYGRPGLMPSAAGAFACERASERGPPMFLCCLCSLCAAAVLSAVVCVSVPNDSSRMTRRSCGRDTHETGWEWNGTTSSVWVGWLVGWFLRRRSARAARVAWMAHGVAAAKRTRAAAGVLFCPVRRQAVHAGVRYS